MPDSSHTSGGLGPFLAELKRRHVVRAALAYAAVVFVLLQAAEIVLPAFLDGPRADGAIRVLVVALALLFPVVLVLAWVYEITPGGIRTMATLDAEAGYLSAGRLVPRVALLLVTVLAAGGAGLWWYRTDAEATSSTADRGRAQVPFVPAATADASGPIRSLAVLPLESFAPEGAGEQDYFVAGMHEALISQLSQLSSVRVISRTSSAQVDRRGKSLPQIGAELGVDAVVEGSVLRADDRVRITVQLIHAASDTHLWARDYERDLVDVIGLQREVAEAIAAEIEARLAEREDPGEAGAVERVAASDVPGAAADSAAAPTTASTASTVPTVRPAPPVPAAPEVQDAVFRGRFALDQDSDGGVAEARRHFLEALRLDSAYVPALVGLAGTRLVEGLSGEGTVSLDGLLDAHRIARRAVDEDPGSAEAAEVLHSVEQALSELGARVERRGPEARQAPLRVMHAAGDSIVLVTARDTVRVPVTGVGPVATEFGTMMQVVLARNDAEEEVAEAWLRGVRRLEIAGRLGQAAEQARATVDRYPEYAEAWAEFERLQALTGRIDAAVRARRDRETRLGPAPGPDAAAYQAAVQRDGAAGYWRLRLSSIEALRATGATVSGVLEAEALVAVGRLDEAISALERARAERDPRLALLRRGPIWDALRGDARFQRIVRTLSGP